jgi:integrase
VARTASARAAGFDGFAELTTENIHLRTACYIVIDMFSGIRDSEMMSIAENCIAPGKSRDGSTDVLWLHGTVYKTGLRAKKWLVPPVVTEAVDVLTRLTAPLREKMRQEKCDIERRISLSIAKEKTRLAKRLDTVRKQKDKIVLSRSRNTVGGSISVLSGTAMGLDLKRFCADLGIRGEDGHPYPLHSHQLRRTYARFIARSELGDLLTLRDHFGHWSIDMTVYYADGGADEYEADTELLEMVAEEKLDRQNEIMGSYLDSDAPLANGNQWLKSWRSSVRTAANKEALIAEYAGSITLTGTGHSWCVGIARGTCCGGLCVFEAQMCVDCNHGIIGLEHRPVWQGIREQQLEALALDDMGPGGRARAQQILECAEKVLRRLDGQEAT